MTRAERFHEVFLASKESRRALLFGQLIIMVVYLPIFALTGVANWYVAFHYPTDTWVNFKVWGGIGLFLLFAVAQGLWLSRHITEEAS